MMLHRVTFTDPRTGTTYQWPNNPPWDAISQASGKQRQITRDANTAHVGAVRQQGDDGPFVLHWEPLVWTQAHEVALWAWYALSGRQSIYLSDFRGDQYEGQITTLLRQEIGALGGPGETAERNFYVKVTFEFEAWRFLAGTLATAGVAA